MFGNTLFRGSSIQTRVQCAGTRGKEQWARPKGSHSDRTELSLVL